MFQKAKFWGLRGFILSLRGLESVAIFYTVLILVLCVIEVMSG